MKFVVEDGTGLPLANAFVSIFFTDDYAEEMSNLLWGHSFDDDGNPLTAEQEELKKQRSIIQASRYISAQYVWLGNQLKENQGLCFPRVDCPVEGDAVTFPYAIQQATAMLAMQVYAGANLFTSLDRGGLIKEVRVAVVDVKYADNAPAGRTYPAVEALIRPYARGLAGTNYITTVNRW